MNSSKNTKKSLIKKLKRKYGDDFKSPLARALGVNVTTIRRLFNQREEIPLVYVRAIDCLCDHMTENEIKAFADSKSDRKALINSIDNDGKVKK